MMGAIQNIVNNLRARRKLNGYNFDNFYYLHYWQNLIWPFKCSNIIFSLSTITIISPPPTPYIRQNNFSISQTHYTLISRKHSRTAFTQPLLTLIKLTTFSTISSNYLIKLVQMNTLYTLNYRMKWKTKKWKKKERNQTTTTTKFSFE